MVITMKAAIQKQCTLSQLLYKVSNLLAIIDMNTQICKSFVYNTIKFVRLVITTNNVL